MIYCDLKINQFILSLLLGFVDYHIQFKIIFVNYLHINFFKHDYNTFELEPMFRLAKSLSSPSSNLSLS